MKLKLATLNKIRLKQKKAKRIFAMCKLSIVI